MKQLFTITLLTLMFVTSLSAQNNKPRTDVQQYEYLTIVKEGDSLYISIAENTSFQKLSIKSEIQHGQYDQGPVLKRIQLYESEGWEFVSNDMEYAIRTKFFYTLRRKK